MVAVSLAYLDKTLGCGIWGTYGIGQGRGMTQISIYTIMLLFVLKLISLRTLSHGLGDLTPGCNDELTASQIQKKWLLQHQLGCC